MSPGIGVSAHESRFPSNSVYRRTQTFLNRCTPLCSDTTSPMATEARHDVLVGTEEEKNERRVERQSPRFRLLRSNIRIVTPNCVLCCRGTGQPWHSELSSRETAMRDIPRVGHQFRTREIGGLPASSTSVIMIFGVYRDARISE